jgi:hypothetical protein
MQALLDPLLALNRVASLSNYRADQRWNFSRKSTRVSEGSELCQRA